MADVAPWTRHALDGVAQDGRYGTADGAAGVHAVLDAPSIAMVAAYRAHVDECRDRLATWLGVERDILAPRRAVCGQDREAIWTGPERWLILVPGQARLEAMLTDALGSSAAVTDQSDGRFRLQLSGQRVRDALVKGVAIDLHPRVFREGDCASLMLSHLNCAIARRHGPSTYDLVGPRAATGDVWHWLIASAGEYGLQLETRA